MEMNMRACTYALMTLPLLMAGGRHRSPGASRFAAPQVIVANGGPLRQRVVLADLDENLRLMLATTAAASVQSASLKQRPRIRVAMYWGTEWKGKLDLPDSVGPIAATNGAQPGAFYPALRGQPAIWLFGAYGVTPASARLVKGEGLAILAKHKIPTRLD